MLVGLLVGSPSFASQVAPAGRQGAGEVAGSHAPHPGAPQVLSTVTVKVTGGADALVLGPATDESYYFEVALSGTDTATATVTAATVFGARHGLESLAQLVGAPPAADPSRAVLRDAAAVYARNMGQCSRGAASGSTAQLSTPSTAVRSKKSASSPDTAADHTQTT